MGVRVMSREEAARLAAEQGEPEPIPDIPQPKMKMGRFERTPPAWWSGDDDATKQAQGVTSFLRSI